MANHIDDATIEYVGILAKLELSGEEKEQAKKDMESMLDYVDKLNELDTSSVEPMSHVFFCDQLERYFSFTESRYIKLSFFLVESLFDSVI